MTSLEQSLIGFILFGVSIILWICINEARENLKRYDCEHRFTFDDGEKTRCLDCNKKLKNKI